MFSIKEYFPLTSFYESVISFSVVISGECSFRVKLKMVVIVEMAAVIVCNILTLECAYSAWGIIRDVALKMFIRMYIYV